MVRVVISAMWKTLVLFCIAMTKSVASADQGCPAPPVDSANCTQILTWNQFANAVNLRTEQVVFCSFSITKSANSPHLVIEHNTSLICQQDDGKCIIDHEASNGKRRFVKIKGPGAQVTMSGFVFKNAGDRSINDKSYYSAVQIGNHAGEGAMQLFCDCDFIGNKGNIRGVALRSEQRTNVTLMNCEFWHNLPSSIGTVFNRGQMHIEQCKFSQNYGLEGSALGSQRNSKTVLKQNEFTGNTGVSPIFFHALSDFQDMGGNIANGNSCNGAFVKSCVDFLDNDTGDPPLHSPTPPPLAQPTLSKEPTASNALCKRKVDHISWCTNVNNSFQKLKSIVESKAGTILFCEFDIEMSADDDFIFVTSDIELICEETHKCRIKGPKRHLVVRGSSSKLFVQGFVFEGSKEGAVHVEEGTTHVQSFCNNIFKKNVGRERGLGIRTERNTETEVSSCRFEQNESSDMGGGIFSRGIMLVEHSLFYDNIGRGGCIAAAARAIVAIESNKFYDNIGGDPIFFHTPNIQDQGGNILKDNSGCGCCDGAYIQREGGRCALLDIRVPSTPAPIIQLPSMKPNVLPSTEPPVLPPVIQQPSPSDRPSLIPSQSPHESNNASCERKVDHISWCTNVNNSFQKLKSIVESKAGTILFCEFDIEMSADDDFIFVTSDIELICEETHKCRIKGPKRHLVVRGSSSKLFVQGFVFEGSKEGAVLVEEPKEGVIHVEEGTTHVQSFCNNIFRKNVGRARGLGIRTERNTETEVSSCRFEQNGSSDMGGGIFSRGAMLVEHSLFYDNIGRGGCIAAAARAIVAIESNKFYDNIGGDPIFFHTPSMQDQGGNILKDNSGCGCCDGALIQREGDRCHLLNIRVPTVSHPTPAPFGNPQTIIGRPAPRGGTGYLNYDISDEKYGPKAWEEVSNNPEYFRYKELSNTLRRPLYNKCGSSRVNQSPIDLCENIINDKCKEHHQTRTHSGDVTLGKEASFQILPSKLRLKYYSDRTPKGGPYPPEADFANNWNGFAEVNHIDVKMPSEHTICGKRYPAELSIFMLHPNRRQTIAMSILMDIDLYGNTNHHFQKAIDGWQSVFDQNSYRCNEQKQTARKMHTTKSLSSATNSTFEDIAGLLFAGEKLSEAANSTRRNLIDETPYGKGGWDPFHPSLERSLYHWGYWGSLTEPPCSNFVAWRVLTEPALISQNQWYQLQKILFTHQDENCEYTSAAKNLSVARPIQPLNNREVYKCSASDYVSDVEKKRMRKETGNPFWCC